MVLGEELGGDRPRRKVDSVLRLSRAQCWGDRNTSRFHTWGEHFQNSILMPAPIGPDFNFPHINSHRKRYEVKT